MSLKITKKKKKRYWLSFPDAKQCNKQQFTYFHLSNICLESCRSDLFFGPLQVGCPSSFSFQLNPCLVTLKFWSHSAVCTYWYYCMAHGLLQEAQLSPRDRAIRRVNWNLANCHATVQTTYTTMKSWPNRWYEVGDLVGSRQCVIDNVHSTMTRSSRLPLFQVS